MAVLARCPTCHKWQGAKNRLCKCGENLLKAKRAKKVKYCTQYYLLNGQQKREVVGYSVEDARAADGKRRAQKRESPRILETLPEEKMAYRYQ